MSQSIVRSVSQTKLGPVIKRCLLSSLVVFTIFMLLLMIMMMMIIIVGLMMRNGCSNRFNYASATCGDYGACRRCHSHCWAVGGSAGQTEEGKRRSGSKRIGSDIRAGRKVAVNFRKMLIKLRLSVHSENLRLRRARQLTK